SVQPGGARAKLLARGARAESGEPCSLHHLSGPHVILPVLAFKLFTPPPSPSPPPFIHLPPPTPVPSPLISRPPSSGFFNSAPSVQMPEQITSWGSDQGTGSV
ncbi:hypothetical protein BaRGS_00000915, partial [Batillaria attramentaria]